MTGMQWHDADLLDEKQIAALMVKVQPTHLLHFAWFAVPGKYWTSGENIQWVKASLELLREFARHGGERAVISGTCAEYDWRYGFCSEDLTPLGPSSLYGVCKHSLRIMVEAWARQSGVSTAWGRIFFLYGPYEHPDRLVSSVICGLLRGQPVKCTAGHQIRDFLYVADVAEAFVALLESKASGPVNIASGQPVALKEIVSRIADQLGGHELIELGAIPIAKDEPPLLVADIARLKREVGWSPRYSLDDGLKGTIAWWRDNLPEGSEGTT